VLNSSSILFYLKSFGVGCSDNFCIWLQFILFTHTARKRLYSHDYFSALCSFDKIIRKEIPSEVVYEDEKVSIIYAIRVEFLLFIML
jgi:hypothetical protein